MQRYGHIVHSQDIGTGTGVQKKKYQHIVLVKMAIRLNSYWMNNKKTHRVGIRVNVVLMQ